MRVAGSLVIVGAALAVPMLVSAQQVSGRVLTPDGFGIVGVEVQVLPSGPRATTDSDGRFVLRPVDTGGHLSRARLANHP